MISITKGFAVALLLAAIGHANAVTWQISGNFVQTLNSEDPRALLDLEGTSFTSYLTYNAAAGVTSMLSREFYNYANEGSIVINTLSGAASGNFKNLQTFIFGTVPGNGSIFDGFADTFTLTEQLLSSGLNPVSIDFQFQQTTYGRAAGLASFALPANLNVADFDGGNFVRVIFATTTDPQQTFSIRGQITNVTAVPEPQTYMMLAPGLLLLGWQMRKQRKA